MTNNDLSKWGLLSGSDIPRLKTFLTFGVFLLNNITSGFYGFYWLYTRSLVLNKIKVYKISKNLLNGFAVSVLLLYAPTLLMFMPSSLSFVAELFAENIIWLAPLYFINIIIFLALYIELLFKFHDSLQDIIFSSSDTEEISLNGLFSFLFSSIYLQYKINVCNKKIKTKAPEN